MERITQEIEDPEIKKELIEYLIELDRLNNESRDTNELFNGSIGENSEKSSINIGIISVAYAKGESYAEGKSGVGNRPILWSVLALLALVYLGLAYTLFSSNDPVKIDRAADLIKTLSAFFIGTATCVMT
uniref:Uncharacterized protein n=1 Tax=Candidatus Kentrum sp. FW TaxID=2126338 RepID=A0A450SJ42_9GAMM|nr:MAG: hypothetical protein BECKFW1821B_GA0114236_10155 [Candidatus Kentron sp. FW]